MLDGTVRAIEWVGPDADAFRQRWDGEVRSLGQESCERLERRAALLEEEAEEQDTCSGDGEGGSDPGSRGGQGSSPWDDFQGWLEGYEAKESDGFFGDLLGGPEAGYWGNLGWSGVSIAGDIAGLVPEPTGVAAGFGLAIDAMSAGIGLYDAAQSFQDGDPFGTFDGLVTAGVNLLDIPAGVLSMVPAPHVKVVGEGLGAVTGSLDIAWSALTAQAQMSAIAGGPGDGSTSRYMLEMPGWLLEQTTGNSMLSDATGAVTGAVEDGFGWGSETIRDAVPIIDPIIDAPQHVVENIIPSGAQDWIEGTATDANEWIRDRMPW
ncbi:hypothetical protein ACT3SP_16795 [Brachybacterium sp. AOP43-C2-M15]|uniref:hypothetical protein n=1 Tax=Brachybacterium sp. AOP43-C2-M15 TaxID=3457661 RepID=UPI004033E4F5